MLNYLKEQRRIWLFAAEQRRNLERKCRLINSIDDLLSRHQLTNSISTESLDLGSGPRPRNPFNASRVVGIDVCANADNHVIQADLSIDSIPFPDNSFDFCTAFDFIEHIPRSVVIDRQTRFSFIEVMNEVHRILKPGGLFFHATPAYPAKEAFVDPTHVNIISEDTFEHYFCEPMLYAKTIGYGFKGRFKFHDQAWLKGSKLVSIISAIK